MKLLNLTPNEENILLCVITNDYQTFKKDDKAMIGSPTWTFVCEESGLSGKVISGTISSLTKKGFVGSNRDGNDSTIWVTKEGFEALNSL